MSDDFDFWPECVAGISVFVKQGAGIPCEHNLMAMKTDKV